MQERAKAWRRTQEYWLGNGYDSEVSPIEESNSAEEAEYLAESYEKLISKIESQVESYFGSQSE